MIVVSSVRFDREIRSVIKHNPLVKEKIRKTFRLLKTNPKYPSLRLHKLDHSKSYSVSVDMKIRILFHIRNQTIYLLRIGSHDEVY
jgi:mRNA-degrading endonuclease YafQ of YafQ-DinJ toxin-antitoxin module